MTSTSTETTRFVVRSIATTSIANEEYFGQLDAVVGDGDFGFSLARGFEKVLESLDGYPDESPSALLQAVAMTISSSIGGTSGPIWGTAFLRASTSARGIDDLDGPTIVAMLRASAQGIMARGKAELGEKTLLDALIPATDALETALAETSDSRLLVERFARAMREAAEATRALQAMRGRASYSGARSIGSPDAGAIALAVLTERLAEQWPERPR